MPKKTNPRKRPATMADVERAKNKAYEDSVRAASAIFLTVLLDKFNAEDHIQDVWHEVCKLSEEVIEGRVSIPDLIHVLEKEYEIHV